MGTSENAGELARLGYNLAASNGMGILHAGFGPAYRRAWHPATAAGRGGCTSDRGVDGAQARNLVMDLGDRFPGLRFVIHDREPLFTSAFREVFTVAELRIVTTLARTPRMNAVCERVIATLRRELPDRSVILNERHLTRVLQEHPMHHNGHRPHQLRDQRPADSVARPTRDVTDLNDLRSIRRQPVVAGTISEHRHSA
ncbi:transposase [Nonomuraea endophytica]|uniref:Integrase catalytic domain-containing protein n=1 Tax=Nonomuraea endophytica TaxID=714136 RepID=A0A7W7ZZM3_9ACTN|nr:transposase [Nonomuraea endophytica]MBB5076354.1 hypothetical protein [Nonomuraea endophytica]